MTEPTLSLAYADIALAIGFFLGFDDDYTAWTTQETNIVDRAIQAGLRQFYYPPVIDDQLYSHKWSFLNTDEVITTIPSYETGTVSSTGTTVTLSGGTFPSWTATNGTLVVNGVRHAISSRDGDTQLTLSSAPDSDFSADEYSLYHNGNYDLSDNFGGFISNELTFEPEEMRYCPIKIVSESEIRKHRQVNDTRDVPRFACVRAKTTTGASGQRFEILFYPIPDSEYILTGFINIMLNKIDRSTYPYPVGGMLHSETIKASCIACADLQVNGIKNGDQYAEFIEKLRTSISSDTAMEPRFLGYNKDSSDYKTGKLKRNVSTITYEGVEYE